MKATLQFAWVILFALAVNSCEKQATSLSRTDLPANSRSLLVAKPAAALVTTVENFETGTKAAYADGTVTLSTGVWDFNDALIGNLSTDEKNGSQSARIRNTGSITMEFDLSGATSLTVAHAVFGSDGSSTWQLWASTNSGSSFSQVGSTVTSSSTTLQTASFTVNFTGTVRFQIRKISGGSNRINIDDFTVNGGTTGGGGGTTTGVVFYQNSNYAGTATQKIAKGNYTIAQLQAKGFVNDWASSAQIPSGWTVIMYSNDNFGGTSWTLTANNSWFGALSPSANDVVSSVKIQ